MDNIVESGVIGHDGKLRLPTDRVNAEFSKHKGCRVVARFEFYAAGSTEAQQGYYYGYVVPAIRAGLLELGERKSEQATDEFLVREYQSAGGPLGPEQARQFDKQQITEFLEWLKQYAAENLAVYVEDPRTI